MVLDFKSKVKKHKIQSNLISDTYDTRCPVPAYDETNVKQGVGCVICDIPPMYCPYFDTGRECKCKSQCDFYYSYKPTKIYKTKQSIIAHLETHGLKITNNVLDFYNLKN